MIGDRCTWLVHCWISVILKKILLPPTLEAPVWPSSWDPLTSHVHQSALGVHDLVAGSEVVLPYNLFWKPLTQYAAVWLVEVVASSSTFACLKSHTLWLHHLGFHWPVADFVGEWTIGLKVMWFDPASSYRSLACLKSLVSFIFAHF